MTHRERNRPFSGKSIEQIAREQGKGIMDAFLDLALDDDLRTSWCTRRRPWSAMWRSPGPLS